MGSVGLGNTADLGAFLNRIFPEGLDLGRCVINEALGTWVADPTNTFRAGMLVMRNSSGLVIPSDGTDVLGVAKWNHTSSMFAVAVDEVVVLVGTTASALKHGNLGTFTGGTSVRVASAAKGGGTVYTEGGGADYTVSAANGTVTRVGGGTIPDPGTVYVTYMYQLAETDLLQFQGKNFWNTNDEVSISDNRVAVITQAEILFTTQYAQKDTFALTGANSNLYAATTDGQEGLFTTSTAGSAKFVGRVLQVPTASDPFLGVRLIKTPVTA